MLFVAEHENFTRVHACPPNQVPEWDVQRWALEASDGLEVGMERCLALAEAESVWVLVAEDLSHHQGCTGVSG